ncbi:YetF domain-containing protein [Polaromonas sp.]|uniref:DUF421 domain-containing protein n=1 Tax=Polaromonas sp. TaxID=1869339 RepID=UPI0032651739
MFDLTLPWWEFIVRATLIYVVLLSLVRISGKRTVGQFTPFDLMVVVLLSEGVSNSLTGGDESLLGGLIVAFTLISINFAVAFVTARSRRAQIVVEGRPILIGRDGQLFKEALQAEHVAVAEFEQALREADCELQDMRCAFLEADGKISVLRKRP